MKIEQFGSYGMGDYLRLRQEKTGEDQQVIVAEILELLNDPEVLFFMVYDPVALAYLQCRLTDVLVVEDLYIQKGQDQTAITKLIKAKLVELQNTWSLTSIDFSDATWAALLNLNSTCD